MHPTRSWSWSYPPPNLHPFKMFDAVVGVAGDEQ